MTFRKTLMTAYALSILGFGSAAMAQTDPTAPPAATPAPDAAPAGDAMMKKPMKKHMMKKHMMKKKKM